MSTNETVEPATLEEGRHHHGHHRAQRIKQLAHGRRQKRETARLQDKLPDFADGTTDIKKLRRRLTIKNEIIAAAAEFVGTFLFLFFALGIATQSNYTDVELNKTTNAGKVNASQLILTSLGFGFSLAVNAWVFFRISGGLFNPAVTFGLFLTGSLTWYRSIILCIMQFVAAIAASGITQLIIPSGIDARTVISNGVNVAQGFFAEMFCTAMLMFTIYLLAGEKHKATFLAPIGIGLALFLAEMFCIPLTGGSLNPARTLGPDVIAANFKSTTWIYYTAPFVGTMLSALLYWLLKVGRYETANEGQDDNDDGAKTMLLRDTRGNITGVSQQVDSDAVPQIANLPGNGSSLTLAQGADAEKSELASASRAPSVDGVSPDRDRESTKQGLDDTWKRT